VALKMSRNVAVIGIDPGTSKESPLTAVCLNDIDESPTRFFQSYIKKGYLSGSGDLKRLTLPHDRIYPLYAEFLSWLDIAVPDGSVESLIFVLETPIAVQNGNTTMLLAQVNFALQMACSRKLGGSVGRIEMVTPGTWKKAVLGKGNFKKALILKEIYKKWGHDIDSDDKADAYCMARYGFSV